jgi:glycerophosphoryl diester phosphodiesterase
MMEYYVLGHRGWAGAAPENTMASFALALEDPRVEVIECDVQMSKDGELVVIHDYTLDRTSTGSGLVRDHTLEELRALDFGSWRGDDFAGERIPLLGELLALVGGKKRLLVEIKETAGLYPGIESKVLSAIERYPADRIMLESFNHALVARLKELAPTLTTGLIFYDNANLMAEQLEHAGCEFAAIYFGNLTQRLVDQLDERGVSVFAWTLNEKWQYDYLKTLDGRFYIGSDFPGMAVRELGEEGFRGGDS